MLQHKITLTDVIQETFTANAKKVSYSYVVRELFYKMEETMAYTKPQVIAQNASTGSYAAGCPEKDRGPELYGTHSCINCERTKQIVFTFLSESLKSCYTEVFGLLCFFSE